MIALSDGEKFEMIFVDLQTYQVLDLFPDRSIAR